ncbi:2OG-Fe(II) oxygenase [Nocardia sp. CNY236]|uniref:2OG-Fe(II) oxygenase n=1 Tax=Nocardia sp. CNY236 TaxID=1169152 RepID=UPI0004152B86|nr:2OG-Fe(II) oxygenase [Nocardia sp. CNY236]
MSTTGTVRATAAAPRWFADLFAHRRWVRRSRPFPHVYARDVFVPTFYHRLTAEWERVRRDRSDSAVGGIAGVDRVPLSALRDGPLAIFSAREWHDLIAGLGGVEATGDIEGSVCRHGPETPPEPTHNDLAPAWFPGPSPGPGDIRLPDDSVDTRTGERAPGIDARQSVRAVAVEFYLGNSEWEPGDGGETGLYDHRADATSQSAAIHIPPVNNSLVVFEVTPRSWHAFAGANTKERTCVTLWVHRSRTDAAQRWGGDTIGR